MRVLVINLDRATERLQHVNTTFGAAGVPFERMTAVDGRNLGPGDLARWRQGTPSFYELPPSEVACFLSHRRCWEMVFAANEPAAIFEDDVHLGKDAADLLRGENWIPSDAHIVKLETTLSKTCVARASSPAPGGRRLVRLRGKHAGGAGYMLTPAGAKILIAELGPIADPYDQLLFNPAFPLYRRLVTYQLVPALCIQDDILLKGEIVALPSYIQRDRKPPRRQGLSKMWRETRRPFEQAATVAAELMTNFATDRRWSVIPFD